MNRRKFLGALAAAGGTAVLAGHTRRARATTVLGAATPEVTDLRLGIIALTDCSPIVIAHERGLFRKYGLNTTVTKGASWAAIRDSLSNGDIQATHMRRGGGRYTGNQVSICKCLNSLR
jgi:nitrate/nitrite transport system substrate-binding protein